MVTDIRIHQKNPSLEIAFDSGEVYSLPYAVKMLEPIGHDAVKFTLIDGKEKQYAWQQLYDRAQTRRMSSQT